MSTASAGEGEATRQKKRKRKKHKGQVEVGVGVGVAPSPPPHAPATPESEPLPPIQLDQTPAPSAAPETPILEEEAAAARRTKDRKRKKRKDRHEEVEVGVGVRVSPSPPPHALATPESEPLPPIQLDQTPAPSAAPETPILEEEAAAARRTKDRKRKKRKDRHEEVAAPSPAFPPAAAQTPILEAEEEKGEAVMERKKKKRKRRKHEEEGEEQVPSSLSPVAVAGIPMLEDEEETATRRKKRKRVRDKEKQEQADTSPQTTSTSPSGQSPPPPEKEEQEEADGSQVKSVKRSNGKNPRVLSTREIIKMRMELRNQQQPPEVFVAAMTMISNPNSNSDCIGKNTNHSSPFGAFFDQFSYKPAPQAHNAPLPRTPDHLARPPPPGNPSSESSQPTTNETSKSAKANTSKTSKTTISKKKQPGSASGSRDNVMVNEKEKPENKRRTKKQRKPPPLLTHSEKCSDKYRRLPLDQLVPLPRSPHKLLQEKYASDPWKVIVICMLLNLTQGKQVRKKVKGFFKRYPDAQTAFNADAEKMAEYLAPLGLQRVKANRIQKFSKAYVEEEWTYITELCGVGKYAADAYAIFCAGRAAEVVPEDHKLVDYWKYVCFEMPTMQKLARNSAKITNWKIIQFEAYMWAMTQGYIERKMCRRLG